MAMSREQRETEVAELTHWCLSVTNYLATLSNDPAISDFANVVRDAHQAGSISRLKSLKRDLTEWGRGLTPDQQCGLDAALNAHVGTSFCDEKRIDQGLVDEILARGEIRTDHEYRVMSEWLDLLSSSSEPEKVAAIDALLTSYGTH